MRRKKLIIIAILAIAVSLGMVLGVTMANRPPVIDSLQAESKRVFPLETTQLVCAVSARDAAELNYEWSATGGAVDGEGAAITWTAPESEGFYYISLTVTNRRGREATGHVMITVKANQSPVINSLTSDADWTTPAGSVNVTCDAEDYDGHLLNYEWSASAGHFDGTGPEITWTAPEEVGIYEITAVVRDDYGGSVSGTLLVSVMPDEPPDVEALLVTKDRYEHCYLIKYSWGYKVGQRQKYDIECIVADTGVELFYEWSCDAGEISEASEDGSMITWVAPSTSGFITVTVVVSDIAGNTASPKSVSLDVVGCSACTFRDCG